MKPRKLGALQQDMPKSTYHCTQFDLRLWLRNFSLVSSVTRLGDFLEFGQLFKAFGNNLFPQISHILRQFLWRCLKSIIFLVKSFLGNFYRHLAILFWSDCWWAQWIETGRAKFKLTKDNFCPTKMRFRRKVGMFKFELLKVQGLQNCCCLFALLRTLHS